ncbi:hypothetical protein FRC04_010820 [Tulasnella sp. 424]|nr:hypothetical protein FRC04_010820 [Tulasnella sp. 424]
MRFRTPLQRLLSFLPNIVPLNDQTDIVETPRINLANREAPSECQSNSTFAQIPEEILLLITDHLDTTAKASLIRTCRYFHRMLEVNLYRRITTLSPWCSHRYDCLFRTLEQRQNLLPCIRTYHGPLLPAVLEPPPEPAQKQSFLGKFKRWRRVEPINYGVRPINPMTGFKRAVFIFQKAINIEELHFTDSSTWLSDPLFEPIQKAVSEMSLRKLTLWHCEGMTRVLRDQPELEELSFGWNDHGLEQLEKTDVPKLKALTASLQEAALLVPGRPIERLRLLPGFGPQDSDEPLFDNFLLSTTRITAFSIRLYHPWEYERLRTAIRAIARTLPELERLTMTVEGQISGRVLSTSSAPPYIPSRSMNSSVRSQILDEIPCLQSIRYLAFLDARLATAADQTYPDALNSTQLPRIDDIVQQTPAVEEWDDLFAQLRDLCPSLVDVSYTPLLFIDCYGSSM